MWLFFLSVLVMGSIQTLTIGYPYRSWFFYNPTEGLRKNSILQRYILYVNTDEDGHMLSYSFLEPIYAVPLINYTDTPTSTFQSLSQEKSNELIKAQEAHFRAWSLQQYQVLKLEIDALKAEGKEPSVGMLLKFLPLQKIALCSDYSEIADLPEVKQIREEHSKIWKNVRISDLQDSQANDFVFQENINNYNGKLGVLLKPFGESSGPGNSREMGNLGQLNIDLKTTDKFNIYNGKTNVVSKSFGMRPRQDKSSQKDKFDKLNAEESYGNESKFELLDDPVTKQDITELPETTFVSKIGNIIEITEIPQITFAARIDGDVKVLETMITEKPERITLANEQNSQDQEQSKIKLDLTNSDLFTSEKVLDITEVMTKNDNFRKVSQTKLKNDAKQEIEKLISNAPTIYFPQKVVDTEEVKRAREEHLYIVKEALLKAKLAHDEKQKEVANV